MVNLLAGNKHRKTPYGTCHTVGTQQTLKGRSNATRTVPIPSTTVRLINLSFHIFIMGQVPLPLGDGIGLRCSVSCAKLGVLCLFSVNEPWPFAIMLAIFMAF